MYHLFKVVFALLLCSIGNIASAHDVCLGENESYEESAVTIGVGASISQVNYELNQKYSLSDEGFINLDSSDDFALVALDMSFAISDFYLVLSAETTPTSKINAEHSRGLGENTANHIEISARTTYERKGGFLTLGWNVNEHLTLFTGYQTVRSDYKDKAKRITRGDREYFVDVEHYDFESSGPYLGASTQYHFGDIGALSLSASFAALSGTLTREHQTPISLSSSEEYWSEGYEHEGNSTGLSVSLSWNSMISESFGYYLKLKHHNYEYDMDDHLDVYQSEDFGSTTAVTRYDLNGTVEESVQMISFGVNLYF